MKHRITFSMLLTLSLLVSFGTFPVMAQGQQALKRVADTGVITLGPNQVLRVTVTFIGTETFTYTLRFRRAAYTSVGCNNDGVCKHQIVSQSLSAPVMLAPNETASIDIGAFESQGVRAAVLTNHTNVRVNAMIVDMTTGNIQSIGWPTGPVLVG